GRRYAGDLAGRRIAHGAALGQRRHQAGLVGGRGEPAQRPRDRGVRAGRAGRGQGRPVRRHGRQGRRGPEGRAGDAELMGTLSRFGGAVVAAATTAALDRAARRMPKQQLDRFARTNFRGEPVTLLEGPVTVAGALVGTLVSTSGRERTAALVAGAVSGAVGAYDDLFGTTQAKGFRGHLSALKRGDVTSGAIKIAGVGAAGLVAAALLPKRSPMDRVADAALIAGTANLVNLLDLRPGRALKAGTALSAPVLTFRGPAAATIGAA